MIHLHHWKKYGVIYIGDRFLRIRRLPWRFCDAFHWHGRGFRTHRWNVVFGWAQ